MSIRNKIINLVNKYNENVRKINNYIRIKKNIHFYHIKKWYDKKILYLKEKNKIIFNKLEKYKK